MNLPTSPATAAASMNGSQINAAIREKTGLDLDFVNCFNAMHEAEKVLDINIMSPSSPRYEYARQIYKIAPWNEQPIRATARLRAEAFLRVFNLWKE